MVFYIQQRIYHEREAKGMAQMLIGHIPYSFPTTWQMTSFVSGFILFFPGLLVIISITNEFSFKTHRQNIIDGWSRSQFITVKMMLACLLSVISTIVVVAAAAMFGLLEGSRSFSLDNFYYIWLYFFQAISYTMLALLLGVLIKRGALSIGLYFLYALPLQYALNGLLSLLVDTSGRYLPLQSVNKLIPLPAFEQVQKQLSKPINMTAMFIVSLIYLAAFFYFSNRKFKTDDL
jgi:hypothetical protein